MQEKQDQTPQSTQGKGLLQWRPRRADQTAGQPAPAKQGFLARAQALAAWMDEREPD